VSATANPELASRPPDPAGRGVGRGQLRALTGLRYLAALGVFLDHFWLRTRFGTYTTTESLVGRVASRGSVGVQLFFVLSGFVLAYAAGGPMPPTASARREFWVARFARIYPAYLLALAAAVPELFMNIDHYVSKFGPRAGMRLVGAASALVLTLLQSWVPPVANFWNGPGWTLSVEAFFYAAFPLLVSPRSMRLLTRIPMVPSVLLWWSVGIAAPLALLALRGGALPESERYFLHYLPVLNLPWFIIGIVMAARFLETDRQSERVQRSADTLVWIGIGSVLATLALPSGRSTDVIVYYAVVPAFALLIYALALARGLVARLLGTPAMVLLGDSSYAFYLLHLPLTYACTMAFGLHVTIYTPHEDFGLSIGQTATALLVTTLVSILVHRYYERPLRDLIRGSHRQWSAAGQKLP